MTKSAEIQINGKPYPLQYPIPLSQLLEQLRLHAPHLAVVVNGEIITHSRRGQKLIQADDQIEITQAVAGG